MLKKIFIVFLISLSFLTCKGKKKRNLLPLAILAALSNRGGSPAMLPIKETYEDAANFTLPIDSDVTISPPTT